MAAACRRIVVIQGHPDRCGGHFCHALANEYVRGARGEGHRVEVVELAAMEIPFIRSRDDLRGDTAPDAVRAVQASLRACDHVLLIYPIWNGGAPALVRAFMEQAFRPSFTFPDAKPEARFTFMSAFTERKVLKGKSARVITTMQMPALVYRLMFRPHQEANALWLAGVRPVKQTPIGAVEAEDGSARAQWLSRVFVLGQHAA